MLSAKDCQSRRGNAKPAANYIAKSVQIDLKLKTNHATAVKLQWSSIEPTQTSSRHWVNTRINASSVTRSSLKMTFTIMLGFVSRLNIRASLSVEIKKSFKGPNSIADT